MLNLFQHLFGQVARVQSFGFALIIRGVFIGILKSIFLVIDPAPSLPNHKHRIAKQQFTILPKAAEQRVVRHIDNAAAAHILYDHQ